MLLSELLVGVEYRLSGDSLPVGRQEVTRIVTAPQGALQSALYICTARAIADARDGMAAAYANGCRLFLCAHDAYPGEGCVILLTHTPEQWAGELTARLLGFPARQMTVIGISGMVGKTSTALLLEQMVKQQGICVSSLTSRGLSLEKEGNMPRAIVPDAVEIQYALQKMATAGTEVAILEFSPYQLAHFAAKSIPFAAVLLTNTDFSPATDDFDRSLGRRRAALLHLLEEESGFAVLPRGVQYQGRARPVWLGKGGDAFVDELHLHTPLLGAPQLCGTVEVAGEKIAISAHTCADFFAKNAVSAALLARLVGVSSKEIAQVLTQCEAPTGLCCIYAQKERLVYTDSGYLPQHLAAALIALRKVTEGRLSVLLGSVGGRALARRAALGHVAAEYADFVYLTADDPDAEAADEICTQMLEGITEKQRAVILPDRVRAIKRAVSELRPGDVLLLFGKGRIDFQLIGGARIPLHEQEIVSMQMQELSCFA